MRFLALAVFCTALAPGCWLRSGSQTGEGPSAPRAAHLVPGTELLDVSDIELAALLKPSPEWQAERFAEAASRQLDAFFDLVVAPGEPSRSTLSSLVDASIRSTPLRPRHRDRVFHDDVLSVWREAASSRADHGELHLDSDGFHEAVLALRRSLGAPENARIEFEIFDADVDAANGTCSVAVECSGIVDGRSVQQNVVWRCRFQRRGDSLPRLVSVELDDYEEIVRHGQPGPLLAQSTSAILGSETSYADQLGHGIDHWRAAIPAELQFQGDGWQGLAVGDVNGDGLDDLYVCEPAGLPNRLFVQQPDGTAREMSADSGVDWLDATRSALLVDLDNDGDQDLALALVRGLLLLANDGSGHFTIRGHRKTLGEPFSLSAADYDQDGRLDLFVCCYRSVGRRDGRPGYPFPLPFYDATNGSPNVLLRNVGRCRFEDVTDQVGLDADNDRLSAAAAWEDFDNDGDLDLYVANDFGRNCLYRNEGAKFTNLTEAAAMSAVTSSTSVAWADLDHDGRMDLFSANRYSAPGLRITGQSAFHTKADASTRAALRGHAGGSWILRNTGGSGFRRVGEEARVSRTGRPWGALFTDLNNDGWHDLVVPNGFASGHRANVSGLFWREVAGNSPRAGGLPNEEFTRAWARVSRLVHAGCALSGRQRNRCFLNEGGFRFANVSAVSGFDLPEDARAAVLTDWDQDGRVDLWLFNRTGPRLRYFRNMSQAGNHYLALRLEGRHGNRDAIGARVELALSGETDRPRIQTLRAGGSFLSQSTKWIHFGTGTHGRIEKLVVRWPGGAAESFTDLTADRRYGIVEGSGRAEPFDETRDPFVEAVREPAWRHEEVRRTVFVSRPFVPQLDETGFVQATSTAKPRLLVLWSPDCRTCLSQLDELARHSDRLRDAEIEVVAVNVEQAAEASGGGAEADLTRASFPFASAHASPDFFQRFNVLYRTLFDKTEPLPLPTSLLVDSGGGLTVLNHGLLRVDQLLSDVALLDAPPDQLRDAAVPFAGRWYALQPPGDNPLRAVRAFANAGRSEDAIAYLRLYLAPLNAPPADPSGQRNLVDLGAARAYHELGIMLTGRGRREEAVDAFRSALEFAPEHRESLVALGRLLAARGDSDQASANFEIALKIRPDDTDAMEALGMLRHREGQVRQAIQLWSEALRLRPNAVNSANNLAWALVTTKDPQLKDTTRAVELAEFVCQATNFRQPRFLDTLATAYLASGRRSDAAGALRKALDQLSAAGETDASQRFRERLRTIESDRHSALPSSFPAANRP